MKTFAVLKSRAGSTLIVGGFGLAMLGCGIAVSNAEVAPAKHANFVNACAKDDTGALFLHGTSVGQKTFTCPTGEKPLRWRSTVPVGPVTYVGKGRFTENGNHGVILLKQPRVFAETPALPAGVYSVSATADLARNGIAPTTCFLGIFGAAVHDSSDRFTYDDAGSGLDEASVATSDSFVVTVGQRIAFYCEASNVPSTDGQAQVRAADLVAVPASKVVEADTE